LASFVIPKSSEAALGNRKYKLIYYQISDQWKAGITFIAEKSSPANVTVTFPRLDARTIYTARIRNAKLQFSPEYPT